MAKDKIMEAVEQYCKEFGWADSPRYLPGTGIYFAFEETAEFAMCRRMILVRDEDFICYCEFPFKIPKDRHNAVSEYLDITTMGLFETQFCLDRATGCLQSRCRSFCGKEQPSLKRICQAMQLCTEMLEMHTPYLMSVIGGQRGARVAKRLERMDAGVETAIKLRIEKELEEGEREEETAELTDEEMMEFCMWSRSTPDTFDEELPDSVMERLRALAKEAASPEEEEPFDPDEGEN